MHLLNTKTLKLHVFHTLPEFAILSHTWGSDEEEVTFQEIQSGGTGHLEKKGFRKIARFCGLARRNGYEWGWVDTCCIDKSSSAELSEAINSMYKWYKFAHVCYAYLEDVDVDQIEDFRKSRWFSRGWTLQELLAPGFVEFFDKQWNEIGTRFELRQIISEITGIDEGVLRSPLRPHKHTVALRMSWASERQTTRVEDQAYCLLGIFDVTMPLLYGEGYKAFQRLQEEIFKISEDYTLLAWKTPFASNLFSADRVAGPTCIFAKSARNFGETPDLSSLSDLRTADKAAGPTGTLAKPARDSGEVKSLRKWSVYELQPISWNPYRPTERDFHWRGRPADLSFTSTPGVLENFEPPRVTARGLRITLPFVMEVSPPEKLLQRAHLAFLYCTLNSTYDMVCLVLHKSDSTNPSAAKGEYYRADKGPCVHFLSPRSVRLQFRTVYIRTESKEEDPRWYWLSSHGNAAYTVAITGEVTKPRIFQSRAKDVAAEPILLVHLLRGSYRIQLVACLRGQGRGWCSLTKCPSTRPAEEDGLIELLAAMRGRRDVNQGPTSTLYLDATLGAIQAVLKERSQGWIDVHKGRFEDLDLDPDQFRIGNANGRMKTYSLDIKLLANTGASCVSSDVLSGSFQKRKR